MAGPRKARAVDCDPDSEYSSCFDADNLWFPASPERFVSIAGGRVLPSAKFSLGLGTSYLLKPITLRAPSPDPEDRTIRIVDSALNTTLLFAIGLGNNLEASLAAPVGLYQRGSGIKGITSQRGESLPEQALHDPRIGGAVNLDTLIRVPGLVTKARLELSLPLGAKDRFAGARGFVLQPSISSVYQTGRFIAGAELGVRLRQPVPFAGVRIGSQLLASLGVGLEVLQDERLSFLAEAWILPSLGNQQPASGNRQAVHVSLIPAEWLASARSRPVPSLPWLAQLGFGTGLPLSTETRITNDGETSDYFLGVTSPEIRVVLVLRYAPIAEEEAGDTP